MTQDVGGDRRDPGASGANDLDFSTAEPAIAAPLDVRVGDLIRYRGTYDVCEAEVIELRDDCLLMIRRTKAHQTWSSRAGGVRPLRRERVIEIVAER